MKFSLWNFRDWYEKHDIDLSYMITENNVSISMLSTDVDASEGRLGCALVLSGDQLTDCTGFRSALQFGRDRILFPVASSSEVFNLGNEMIEHYTLWENSLLDEILSGETIDSFLQHSQDNFPFPMALLHFNGVIGYHSSDWTVTLHSQVRNAILKTAMQKQSSTQPFFSSFFFGQPYTFLTDLVYVNHTPFGILIAYEAERKLQPGDIPVFHMLAEMIQTIVTFQSNQSVAVHPLASWYTNYVNSEDPVLQESVVPLSDVQWKLSDYYQVIAIEAPENSSTQLPSDLVFYLTDLHHCCAQTSFGLSILIHLGSDFPQTSSDEITRLQSYCPESAARIGLSLPFQNLKQLPCFYQQSIQAVKLAQKKEVPLLTIASCLSENILSSCRSLPETPSLIDPTILKLAEADLNESDQLLKTLYTYLICGKSISQTADILFIHRNTLRHRLNKIKTYLPGDLDDCKYAEKLLLSLALYQKKTFLNTNTSVIQI